MTTTAATAAREYRVAYTWKNTYGTLKRVTVAPTAASDADAIKAGRVLLDSLYGIRAARFVSVEVAR